MSTPNPFAPPVAHVRDIDEGQVFQPVKIFSIAGRMGRLRYLAYTFGTWLLLSFVGGAIAGGLGAATNSSGVVGAMMIVIYVAMIVLNVMFLIQRSHDMDLSGWFGLLTLIPLVVLYWIFKGGTPGPNRFGAPPPPNTLGVKILAWILPAIMIIGIIAAVSIPAYVDYQKRAQRSVQTN
jgi:uncharacterized membrane protein YhaH (DUF805 family)